MKEIILLTIATGLIFLMAVLAAVFGFIRKRRNLKLLSLSFFILFFIIAAWTGYRFVNKSYHKVTDSFKPRTGDEIYEALFGKRTMNCVTVLNKQDQVVPKIDYAIWLQFNTCPEELKRILSRHEFTSEKLPTKNSGGKVPYGETLDWFHPATLGDTVLVYEYATTDNRNIQTIWTSLDSTQVFVRDILD